MSSKELSLHDPFQVPDNPDNVPIGPKAAMAFEMRKAGADYELIAEKLGYKNGSSARRAITDRISKYYKANQDAIDEVVSLELMRLDHLQLVCWRRAKDGDLSAVDRILKIMERRSKLMGLDVQTDGPVTDNSTHQTAIFIGGSESEYVEALKEATYQTNGDKFIGPK